MKHSIRQFILAFLLASIWGACRGWVWTDYATSAIIIGIYSALWGIYQHKKLNQRLAKEPHPFG